MTTPYEFFADLSTEDRGRWQLHAAKMDAIRIAPNYWSRQEILDACLDEFRFYQEFGERYQPDDTQDWIITRGTGRILYEVKP